MKRIIVAGAMTASSLIGLGAFIAPAAHADGCPAGTILQVNYNVNINGQVQQGTQCVTPPAAPSLP
jgi:hypothetical protein